MMIVLLNGVIIILILHEHILDLDDVDCTIEWCHYHTDLTCTHIRVGFELLHQY